MHKDPFIVRYGKRYDLSVFSSMISYLPTNLFSLLKQSLDMLQARVQLRPCRLLSTVIQYIASACNDRKRRFLFTFLLSYKYQGLYNCLYMHV